MAQALEVRCPQLLVAEYWPRLRHRILRQRWRPCHFRRDWSRRMPLGVAVLPGSRVGLHRRLSSRRMRRRLSLCRWRSALEMTVQVLQLR